MVPVGIGGVVHHEEASMGQLQPDHLHCPPGSLPSRVFVPEKEVSASAKGDRSDGAAGGQFSFIVSVLPNVVTAIFVPVVQRQSQSPRNCCLLKLQVPLPPWRPA